MCLVCIEYSKQKLTPKEAIKNLKEMKSTIEIDHYKKVYDKIYEDKLAEEAEEYWSTHYYELLGFGD
tara:strand:- start:81692 stop:81892 length:201 start_codon:yes stop_codon:yes gene_type:complete